MDDVRQVPRSQFAIRFAFGAAISTVAALIGIECGPHAGGLLLAFPAILPATLTLIERGGSERKAVDDVLGAIVGAVALGCFGVVAWLVIPRVGAGAALVGATAAWLVIAFGLYALLRGAGAGKWRSR